MSISVGIIGVGKLGKALTLAFAELNLLKFIVTGKPDNSREIAGTLSKDVRIYDDISEIETFPDILFITVKDNLIEKISSELKDLYRSNLSNTIILHCSGFMPVSILDVLKPCVKSIAKLHPYQTFFSANNDVFTDVAWTATCDIQIKPFLSLLVGKLKGKLYFTDEIQNFDSDKYHISAVFAANYQSVNLKLASRVANLSGINPEDFIPKIALTSTQNSIRNLSQNVQEFTLTGPIARGDIDTIAKQIETLKNNETELKGYILIGLATSELAYNEGLIDSETHNNFKNIFLYEIKKLFSF